MLFFVRAGGCGADILKCVYYALEKSLARVKQEVERCEVLSHEYYHAFSRMREYGRPVYDEGIKERSAYAKCSIDPLLDDDRACWKRMASLVENASYGNSPCCVSPLPDLHPYHEYVWEIIDAMNRGIKIIIVSAQQIDAFVAKPTAEMVAWALQNHICKGDRKISVEIIDDAFIEKTDSWRQICDETEDDDFFNEDDWD